MVGTTQLEVPTASVLLFDGDGRVLLVRHVEGDVWTTPGGMIEPEETPANAAVRETWEETGLVVELTRIVGVFGGPRCTVTYANGDQDRMGCDRVRSAGNRRRASSRSAWKRWKRATSLSTSCAGLTRWPHVDLFVDAALKRSEAAVFQPATWQPPRS